MVLTADHRTQAEAILSKVVDAYINKLEFIG